MNTSSYQEKSEFKSIGVQHKPAEEKKKGVYKNLISGAVAAAIARTAVNPIERIEILRQVDNVDFKGLNLFRSLQKIYQTQGIPGLFKSNSAALVRILPFSAVEFYSFEFYKNIFIRGKENRQNSFYYTFICGALTGLNAITVTFPLDVARTRIAINTMNSNVKDSSILQSTVDLYKNEGFRGLYKGYSLAFVGSIPFVALKQTSFELLKNNFMIPEYRLFLNFIYGSLAGVIGTILLYPTHMIKRVFQANNDKTLKVIPWIKETFRTQGFRGFYKGLSVTFIKIIPYQGLIFSVNEKLKILLGYEQSDNNRKH